MKRSAPRLNTLKAAVAAFSLTAFSGIASAAVVDVKITNLTQGFYFTPLLVSAHGDDADLFEVGGEASAPLQAMAEGGAVGDLADAVTDAGGVNVVNPASGLLAPTAYTETVDFDTGDNGYLTVVAMMLPTNDAFIGLDSWKIPSAAGTYTVYLNAYDAGTEANDELMNTDTGGVPGTPGIPANPGMNSGSAGTGVTNTEANDTVHIHRGALGDTNAEGGASDLDSRIHRWLNPVAKVVVTVK